MKKLVKLSLLALSSLSIASLGSCSKTDTTRIGILEFITQDALENVRKGFTEELANAGFKNGENITIDYQNPEADSAADNTMAAKLVRSSDIVFGIATPSALALKTQVEDQEKDIPLMYSAVTDPVASGLIKSTTDHGNVVGTSDAGPTAKNIDLFTKFKDKNGNDIKKIGIIYSSTEPNSIIQKKEAQAECDKLGITLVDGGFSEKNAMTSALNGLIGQGIQGLFVPTDNNVAAKMTDLKENLWSNDIVTVCADKLIVEKGGSLGYSVDYTDLGKTTGKMAVKILNGTPASEIDCSFSSSFPLSVNNDFFKTTGITLPSDIAQTVSMN